MYPTKKQKTKDTKNILWFVLDKSSSMLPYQDQTISAYNEYLHGLQKNEGMKDAWMGITIFSDYNTIETGSLVPLREMVPLTKKTYQPSGLTALYDAIASGIQAIEAKSAELGEDVAVIFTIKTDGQNNNSKEMTRESIFQMIEERKKRGDWTFVFLGADQDAYAASSVLGISAGNTLSYRSSQIYQNLPRLELATIDGCLYSTNASTENFFASAPQRLDASITDEDIQRLDPVATTYADA